MGSGPSSSTGRARNAQFVGLSKNPKAIEEWRSKASRNKNDDDTNASHFIRPLAKRLSVDPAASVGTPGLGINIDRVLSMNKVGMHFSSTIKVYVVSSRPNFLQVGPKLEPFYANKCKLQ